MIALDKLAAHENLRDSTEGYPQVNITTENRVMLGGLFSVQKAELRHIIV